MVQSAVPVTHVRVDHLAVGDCVAMPGGNTGTVISIEHMAFTGKQMVGVMNSVGCDVWFAADNGLVRLWKCQHTPIEVHHGPA